MATTGLDLERLRAITQTRPISPIAPPPPPRGTPEPSTLNKFINAAKTEGMNTAARGTVDLAKTHGKPLLDKGIAAITPKAAPTLAQMTGPTDALLGAGPGVGNAMLTGGAQAGGQAALAKAAGAGTGLMSSLGGMGAAAMASPAAPIVGSLLAMKMLGFFSEGGHVGPLSEMSYKSSGGDIMKMSYGGKVK